jgi:hypothetical protein
MTTQFEVFERELLADQALAERILREFSEVPKPDRVLIKTDTASVNKALAHAFALAVEGAEARLELIK